MTSTAPRTSYRSVFASPGYAALYAGSTLSTAGISLQLLAFSVAVFDATRSPFWSSVAFAAGFLPQVLGGVVLPSLADRLPTRLLLPLGSLIRGGCAALLAWGALGLGGSLAVVALAALLQPLFSSAQSGLVARLLTGDRYVLGRSLFTLTSMIAQLLGIAVGGVTLQLVGPGPALLVSAGLQGFSAIVFAVGLPGLSRAAAAGAAWRIGETWSGYRHLVAVPTVRTLLLLWWLPLAVFVGAESLAVAYAGAAHASGVVTSLVIGATPLGALVGEVLVGRFCRPVTRERLVFPLLALLGAALLPLALTPPPLVAAALLGVSSVGLSYELGRQAAFRDALPAGREALGFGLLGVGTMSGQGLGPLIAGPLAVGVGAGPAMAVFGGLVLVATALLRPAVRRVDTGRST